MNDILNDRLARYSFMYRSRNSNKEKTRFLRALVTDISQVRKDISVMEYSNGKKYNTRNVYIGDIEKSLTTDTKPAETLFLNTLATLTTNTLKNYIARYKMDKELLELNFEQEGDQVALMLSIPVIRAKDEEEIEAALADAESAESLSNQ